MGRRKKEITYPHLNNCKGDLGKEWYVEYTLTHPVSGEKISKRIYDGINKHTTHHEREAVAKKIIEEYTCKIQSGWRPWTENKPFTDVLAYKNSQFFSPSVSLEYSYIKPLIAEYINYKIATLNKSSIDDYKSKLRQFCFYLQNQKCLHRELNYFNNSFMISFLRALHDKGLSQKTILKYRQVIDDLFKFIRKVKKIKIADPFAEDIPRMGKIVDFSPASIPESIREMFRREIEETDPQLWLAINFVYYTAIRPGTELRLLKIKQINFSAQCVTVTNELAKNNRTETIDIPQQLFRLITQTWRLQNYDSELYVFSKNGKPGTEPLGKNTMRTRFNTVRDRLNISKDIKYYSFKHSGAQELLLSGANIYDIKSHLRHVSLESTEHYLRKRFGNRNTYLKNNFPEI